ncbi:MAG TPA: cardiolipin synthase [Vicinamibacteria bacterium]|jgi:cardiolipin synthase
MSLLDWTPEILIATISIASSWHALLYKREPRAALAWIAVCLMLPIVGALLYYLFGINRVRTRARELRQGSAFRFEIPYERGWNQPRPPISVLPVPEEFAELARISVAVVRAPLVGGNRIEVLHNGERAFPSMLAAIEDAQRYVFLSTYIFETNHTGRQFIDALSRAHQRGVDVRVIVDGIGGLYSRPRAVRLLRKLAVPAAPFLPPRLLPPEVHINLRNHRKIIVADGQVAFTGGMNIGDRHLAENLSNPDRVSDVHFRLTGPVVDRMERVFLEDWRFVTGADMSPPPADSDPGEADAICQVIADGPNEDLDALVAVLTAAAGSARHRISIVTPYFLPPPQVVSALQAAALRGVEVSVVLPSRNNLPYVHWATRNMLWEVLQRGVRVFYQPPPFAHTKLFLVDDHYAQIGSANWDPRSLRLNFELAVEVYSKPFVEDLGRHFESLRLSSREITLADIDARPLLVRTRDALAWLCSPYL